VREWQYWTRNKLEILTGYLPAFNVAAKRSSERLYIDLMAGEPVNRERTTGEEFDGSARLALSASPSFTRLVLCEMPDKAAILEADLRQKFPHRRFRVYPGDCNETIDQVLADLAPWRWAPTFVFADQQAAEIRWDTLTKVAAFKSGPRKAELWILMSPAMVAKGVAGTNGPAFANRVDALYGTGDWRRVQAARDQNLISAEGYRDEMVNLLRWRLEHQLGYQLTARVPMRMPSGMPIYDMLFATDHPLGDKIMTHLY
jgi:three-Cys-motif partner protein